jgi:hypothetical protein
LRRGGILRRARLRRQRCATWCSAARPGASSGARPQPGLGTRRLGGEACALRRQPVLCDHSPHVGWGLLVGYPSEAVDAPQGFDSGADPLLAAVGGFLAVRGARDSDANEQRRQERSYAPSHQLPMPFSLLAAKIRAASLAHTNRAPTRATRHLRAISRRRGYSVRAHSWLCSDRKSGWAHRRTWSAPSPTAWTAETRKAEALYRRRPSAVAGVGSVLVRGTSHTPATHLVSQSPAVAVSRNIHGPLYYHDRRTGSSPNSSRCRAVPSALTSASTEPVEMLCTEAS